MTRFHSATRVKSLWVAIVLSAMLTGCASTEKGDPAPPPAKVIQVDDMNLLTVDSKDAKRFPVVEVGQMEAAAQLTATGTVSPDISREVPVISLANGRVVDIRARLDDNVKKGQQLFSVESADVTNAFNAYLKAVNNEHLANAAYARAKDLIQHGAIAQSALEQAEASENDAKADLDAADALLKILDVDKGHPSSVVRVSAPISGVIIAQNVTNAAAAGVTLSGSSTAFTIADLSTVWILCDVYENDLPKLQLGQTASIRVNGYPDRPLSGRISDIGPVLDPNLRTAKVRIQVANPGFLRLGMFATATFASTKKTQFAVVPADAVLHLHDRDWVYVPAGSNQFRRLEVRAGEIVGGDRQQILSGIQPGQQVVAHALLLETAGNQ